MTMEKLDADPIPLDTITLERASGLVHDILEQITDNDDPGINESRGGEKKSCRRRKKSLEAALAVQNVAKTISTPKSEPKEVLGSFETDGTEVTEQPLSDTGKYKLGHGPFAHLCVSTLKNVQNEGSFDLKKETCENETLCTTPTKVKVEQTTTTQSMEQTETKNAGSVDNGRKNQVRKFAMPWNSINGLVDPSILLSIQEEKKEDSTDFKAPQLQMFGSEYARHLSTSQLAPTPVRPNFKPRRIQQHKSHHRGFQFMVDTSPEIQTGALLDICITAGDDVPPPGYCRVSETASGRVFGLAGNGNKTLHVNVKKEELWDKAAQRPCVTAISVIFPDRKEFVPPGFSIVRLCSRKEGSNGGSGDPMGPPANLNVCGERVYMCFRRSREGNPITGLLPLSPPEAVPLGYTVVERTPRNFVANFLGASGDTTFWAYRQRLANLEVLRPLPLIDTVIESRLSECTPRVTERCETKKKSNRRTVLSSYYCTGGDTVKSSIGRFHIMDRTTHSLLSPSSVENRLNLIEMSRRRTGDENLKYSYAASYSRSDQETGSTDDDSLVYLAQQVSEVSLENLGDSLTNSTGSVGKSLLHHDENFTPAVSKMANLSSLRAVSNDTLDPVFSGEDLDQQACRDAMAFIPEIESAVGPEADGRLTTRISLLTPIVTACYTRHGGSALVAVEGLSALLSETLFFRDDVDFSDENDSESSTRITLLDIAIQSVCDVVTSGSPETIFPACVDFVSQGVSFSHGRLNTRTIGFVVRFYLFVFYFDASIPSRKTTIRWPPPAWRPVSMRTEEDFPMLYDPRGESNKYTNQGYISGGASQTATLALKDLVSLSIVRLGKISVSALSAVVAGNAKKGTSNHHSNAVVNDTYAPFLNDILTCLVDDAVDLVERANFTQLALHQIHRSGGSELFWHDMIHVCGPGLFSKDEALGEAGKDVYVMIFSMLQQIVKVASGKMRAIEKESVLLPKDTASKLLSLELLLHFLEFWSDEQEAVRSMSERSKQRSLRSMHTLMFVVRRSVVPCLLWNTRAGLDDPQVYRRVIRIISEMWCSSVYRQHCKVELGVLLDHFAVRMLELGPQCSVEEKLPQNESTEKFPLLLAQQIELIEEIRNWFFHDPKDVVVLYLNYDTDVVNDPAGCSCHTLSGNRWQIFQRICAGLSVIAEQCGELIGNDIRHNQTLIGVQRKEHGNTKLQDRKAARLLRKTSLEAIAEIVRALAISASSAKSSDFSSLLLSWTSPAVSPSDTEQLNVLNEGIAGKTNMHTSSSHLRENSIPRTRPVPHKRPESNCREFAGSASSIQAEDPFEKAFEIASQKSLRKAIEFLIACNALTPSPRDIANFLRVHKERLDHVELGIYLSEGGIGRAESDYWKSIRYLFVRSISFIGMTVDEGLRHFLTCSDFRLPGEAQRIDRVLNTFAQCYFEDNAGDTERCPFKDQDTIYLLVFAIIMLNTDLHKTEITPSRKRIKAMTKTEFCNNLRGAIQNERMSKSYLSSIYNSIAMNPISLSHSVCSESSRECFEHAIGDILKNVRSSDSLLRGLAAHDVHFTTIESLSDTTKRSTTSLLLYLTTACVSKTWHQWHGVINTCLETVHLDPQGIEPALDILLYALTTTICLEMKMERRAFLHQLIRLRIFEDNRSGDVLSSPDDSHREEHLLQSIEDICCGNDNEKLQSLGRIHSWINSLKIAFRKDVRNKADMMEAVAELVNGDFLLHDPVRSFRKSGNLLKRSIRTGRSVEYRFFLFSDVLLYAKKESSGRYKIHEELPLHLMKVVDWFPPSQKNRLVVFEIHHPRKSLQVVCDSHEERNSWVEHIRIEVVLEMERKITMEAARVPTVHLENPLIE